MTPSPPLEEHVSSPHAARLLGVKTKTLAMWRNQGKGPSGWFHVSPTLVVYPRSEIQKFLDEKRSRKPALPAQFKEDIHEEDSSGSVV